MILNHYKLIYNWLKNTLPILCQEICNYFVSLMNESTQATVRTLFLGLLSNIYIQDNTCYKPDFLVHLKNEFNTITLLYSLCKNRHTKETRFNDISINPIKISVPELFEWMFPENTEVEEL